MVGRWTVKENVISSGEMELEPLGFLGTSTTGSSVVVIDRRETI